MRTAVQRTTRELAREAKCYGPGNSVGIRENGRLIFRLSYPQFGVLVTASYVHILNYQQIQEDGRPVVILVGRNIVESLKAQGMGAEVAVHQYR